MNLTIEFDQTCPDCGGSGGSNPKSPCRKCCGRCRIPTEFGDALLEFLAVYAPTKDLLRLQERLKEIE